MSSRAKEPTLKTGHPRRYHGKNDRFLSVLEWERLKFSNEWIRKPLVKNFRAEVISIMARLRAKQGEA